MVEDFPQASEGTEPDSNPTLLPLKLNLFSLIALPFQSGTVISQLG